MVHSKRRESFFLNIIVVLIIITIVINIIISKRIENLFPPAIPSKGNKQIQLLEELCNFAVVCQMR